LPEQFTEVIFLIIIQTMQHNIFSGMFYSDPMSHYLHSAQPVLIRGLKEHEFIVNAVTLGDQLYVAVENDTPIGPAELTFVYDMDLTNVRHKQRHRREITCTNKRPLKLKGLFGEIIFMVPCLKSNSLYVIAGYEEDSPVNAVVHQVSPDCSEVCRWSLDLRGEEIRNVSVDASGCYLLVSAVDRTVSVYVTSTGKLEHVMESEKMLDAVADQYRTTDAVFINERSQSIVTVHHDMYGCTQDLAFDAKSQCILVMASPFVLIHPSLDRFREVHIDSSILRKYAATRHWFDKACGLVFCSTSSHLFEVLRITY